MQPIDLQTDSAVRSIHISLAGHEIAILTQPPWHVVVDFGREIDPRALEAIGYDEKGDEVGRATQILNLPRPPAEMEIALQYGRLGPNRADLRWRHLQFVAPKSAMISLDRVKLAVDKNFGAPLPQVDWMHPHLIAAEIKFRDGVVARREIVAGGAVTDTAQSELTPILLTKTSATEPPSFENCLSSNGEPVRMAAVEKPSALVTFIREPDESEAIHALDPMHRARSSFNREAVRLAAQLDKDTSMRILWPLARKFADRGSQSASLLFDSTGEADASRFGLIQLLTTSYNGRYYDEPLQFADAVAVAGLRELAESRRRAVVLILSSRTDMSGHAPGVVRRYMADIGVPLFVWSLSGPRPDLANSWGEVENVSSVGALHEAADLLRETLAAQRIAWVAVDPLTALRLRADQRCGVTTVARLP